MEEREKSRAEITERLKDADEEALRFSRSFLKAEKKEKRTPSEIPTGSFFVKAARASSEGSR